VEGGLLDRVGRAGAHLESRLRDLGRTHAMVREVRGRGLMQGLVLDGAAAPVVDAARERRLLVNGTARTVVRLLPPLTISEPEIDLAIDRLDAALADVEGGTR
jgi:acetylornithine/N-succinyldiaminopimelate aminotransferase